MVILVCKLFGGVVLFFFFVGWGGVGMVVDVWGREGEGCEGVE